MKEEKKSQEVIDTKYISIEMSQLEPNEGQLDGLPANPREIKKEKLELLKENIQKYPEMLKLRGLIVYPLEDGLRFFCVGADENTLFEFQNIAKTTRIISDNVAIF